jgi:predicted MFS family arabinose efflux permease
MDELFGVAGVWLVIFNATSGGIGSSGILIGVLGGLALLALFVLHALRAERPLLDLGLFRAPVFSAATVTNVLGGATLIGSMLLFPLYFQAVRGETALSAGLLTAPQGVGAAMMVPISGRLVDRSRAGLAVLTGLFLMVLSFAAYTQLAEDTSYALLAILLWVVGLGAGCTGMSAMSAAYQTLTREAIPRATTIMNIVQRVGGSISTALFAVVLQRQIALGLSGARGGGLAAAQSVPPGARTEATPALAAAFGHTFWWPLAFAAAAILPALLLPRERPQAQVPARTGSPTGLAAS